MSGLDVVVSKLVDARTNAVMGARARFERDTDRALLAEVNLTPAPPHSGDVFERYALEGWARQQRDPLWAPGSLVRVTAEIWLPPAVEPS